MAGAMPVGTVTFLFTDVEGSTQIWDRLPGEMAASLAEHDRILDQAINEFDGYVFTTAGDSFAVSFSRASQAVECARVTQERLLAAEWPGDVVLRVRMGVHTGEAYERRGDYFGPEVNRAARIMSAAHGGQVLLSSATALHVRGLVDSREVAQIELKGLAGTEVLHQLLAPSLPADFPPIRSESSRSNLPAPRDALIGRGDELVSVVDLLTRERLVSLVGPGGMGKTTLGLAAARRCESRFADGVWFVDLSSVRRDDEVAAAVAGAVGVHAAGRDDHIVVAKVGRLDVLVVLDNCEHVIDGAARFVDRLLDEPLGVILTTSRERLSVRSERVIRVESLGTDGPASDAVALFAARARDAGSEVDLEHDAARRRVAELCRRLDGSPLAIELAAARASTMSVEDISRRLDDRLSLLARRRHHDERHRSIEACVEWSVELLSEAERRSFEFASLFQGVFEPPALGAVSGVAAAAAASDIESLLEMSLLDPAEPTGLSMLESARAVGRERLKRAGRLDAALRSHLAVTIQALQDSSTESGYPSDAGGPVRDEFERLIPDARAAFARALDWGDLDSCVSILDELGAAVGSGFLEAGTWATRLLRLPQIVEHPGYPRVLAVAGHESVFRADVDATREIRNLLRQLHLPAAEVPLSTLWAAENFRATAASLVEGDPSAAASIYEAVGQSVLDRGALAAAASAFASAAYMMSMIGDLDWAEPRARRALELATRTANTPVQAHAHLQVGLAIAERDREHAEFHLSECRRLDAIGAPSLALAVAPLRLARLRASTDTHEGLGELLVDAIEPSYRAGADAFFWPTLVGIGAVFARLGLRSEAVRLAAAADASAMASNAIIAGWAPRFIDRMQTALGSSVVDELRRDGAEMSMKEVRDLIVARASTLG